MDAAYLWKGFETMTPEQLAALREVAAKMQAKAPGPWYADIDDAEECGPHSHSGLSKVESGSSGADWTVARLCETTEANYIAAFDPTTCLALLEEVERLQAKESRCQCGAPLTPQGHTCWP
jgi:hypothetical protein